MTSNPSSEASFNAAATSSFVVIPSFSRLRLFLALVSSAKLFLILCSLFMLVAVDLFFLMNAGLTTVWLNVFRVCADMQNSLAFGAVLRKAPTTLKVLSGSTLCTQSPRNVFSR